VETKFQAELSSCQLVSSDIRFFFKIYRNEEGFHFDRFYLQLSLYRFIINNIFRSCLQLSLSRFMNIQNKGEVFSKNLLQHKFF
jgi:hypothetical protein